MNYGIRTEAGEFETVARGSGSHGNLYARYIGPPEENP